jgi:hypothetical protein
VTIDFKLREYIRRELEALKRSALTFDEIRDLITVTPTQRRWLFHYVKTECQNDPEFERDIRFALAYRDAMLEMLEAE